MLVFVNRKPGETPYIVVVRCSNEEAEKDCITEIKDSTKKQVIKSKTVSKDGIEITVEVRLQQMATEFINRINCIEGVQSAVLVSYNGDYAGC